MIRIIQFSVGRIETAFWRYNMFRFILLVSSATLALSASPLQAQAADQPELIKDWANKRFRLIALSCGAKDKTPKNYVPKLVRDGPLFRDIWEQTATVSPIDSAESLFFTVFQRGTGGATTVGGKIGTPWEQPKAPIIYQFQSNSTVEQNCATLLSASGNADLKLSFVLGNVTAALEGSMRNDSALSAFFYRGRMISPIAAILNDPRVQIVPSDISPFAIKAHIWNWYRTEARTNTAILQQGRDNELQTYRDFVAVSSYFSQGLTQEKLLKGTVAGGASYLVVSAEGTATYKDTSLIRAVGNEFQIARLGEANMLPLPSAEAIANDLRIASAQEIDLALQVDDIPPVENASDFSVVWLSRQLPFALCASTNWIPTSEVASGAAQLISLQSTYESGCKLTGTFRPPTTAENQVRISIRAKVDMPSGTASEAFVLAGPERLIKDWRRATTVNVEGDHSVTLATPGQATTFTLSYAVRERQPSRQVTGAEWIISPSVQCPNGNSLSLGSPEISISRTSSGPGPLSFAVNFPGSFAAVQQLAGSDNQPARCQVKGKVRLAITGLPLGMEAELDRGVLVSLPAEPIANLPTQ